MDITYPPASSDVVLALRAVTASRRAGVRGCLAVARVLVDVDLVLRRGECAIVFGGPASGKSTLLLIAAGALRPDLGDVWIGPGARLRWADGETGSRLAVAERVAGDVESLHWSGEPGAALVVARSPRALVTCAALGTDPHGATYATRHLRLRHGRLTALDVLAARPAHVGARSRRVDSALWPP